MAALCTLGNMPGLIDRVCVARNEQVGVYGFVFYRGKLRSLSVTKCTLFILRCVDIGLLTTFIRWGMATHNY